MTFHNSLSRRERQIMDVLYRKGRASAADVMAEMPDPPGYSAVRTYLAILERKGHVRHEKDGSRFVFIPTVRADRAKRSAVQHLINTFFGGSRVRAAAELLNPNGLTEEELNSLAELIEKSQKDKKR
jgi:predicted transcriptional regulator